MDSNPLDAEECEQISLFFDDLIADDLRVFRRFFNGDQMTPSPKEIRDKIKEWREAVEEHSTRPEIWMYYWSRLKEACDIIEKMLPGYERKQCVSQKDDRNRDMKSIVEQAEELKMVIWQWLEKYQCENLSIKRQVNELLDMLDEEIAERTEFDR